MQNKALSLRLLVLRLLVLHLQHEQLYPERLSVFAPFPLGWIKLAPKFKDFQGLKFIF